MTFHYRRVGRKSWAKIFKQYVVDPVNTTVVSIGLIAVIVLYGFFQAWSHFDAGNFLGFFAGIFGEDLEIDADGHTNILLLGTGGEGHEGENLTDSILVVNINHPKKMVNFVSIPRDLYVDALGGNRINSLYEWSLEKYKDEEEALDFVRTTAAALFQQSIQYALKIDFRGFEKAIDELDGIDVIVPEAIEDPFYPKDGTYDYEPFFIAAGNQHLDGKTALKYVRSRKTSSDFDRGKRQQQVLAAVRGKALEENFFTSTRRLKKIFYSVKSHVATNMDVREMVTLVTLAKDFPKDRVFSWSIHDDPTKAGGFLYTPLRELYSGAFVLLPASDRWDSVKQYLEFIAQAGDVLAKKSSIQILNGTKTAGLASTLKMILRRFGFQVNRFGNAQNQTALQTTFYHKTDSPPEIISLLTQLMPGKASREIPQEYLLPPYQSDAEVIIELGEDFLPLYEKLDVFRNVIELTPDGKPKKTKDSTAAAGVIASPQ